MEKEMLDASVAQLIEQSTDNLKTRARILAQLQTCLFPQEDFKFFDKIILIIFKVADKCAATRAWAFR